MSDQKQTSSSNGKLMIGAAVAVAVAAFGGYKIGFSSGEEGLIALQSKVGELQAAASTSASEVEKQAAMLLTQSEELKAVSTKAQAQLEQIALLQTDVSDKSSKLDGLNEQLAAVGGELNSATTKLSGLTTQLSETERENADYLKTIMAGLGKQDFTLHIGGRHKTLIQNKANLGLSYVSREDRMALVTLSGEQMVLHLQTPERISLEGKRCELNLANLVSDNVAAFELECSN